MQGVLLGAFYWGYICTNFVGGRAAEYFGGKIVFGVGNLLTSLFTLLVPWCARTSTILFIVVRVFQGLSQVMIIAKENSNTYISTLHKYNIYIHLRHLPTATRIMFIIITAK